MKWRRAIDRRLKQVVRRRPDLGDDDVRIAHACLKTAAAVHVAGGGDRWLTVYALRLIICDAEEAFDRGDVAGAMAAASVDVNDLVKRARTESPPEWFKRALWATASARWDEDKRFRDAHRRRAMFAWERRRITVPESPQ